jgi:outer membrane protein OmpA-like peptidoglycan-associated protein
LPEWLKAVRNDRTQLQFLLEKTNAVTPARDGKLAELKKLIAFLNLNPEVKLEIAGHTDDTGNDEYNMKLSELRAESVYNYLVSKGISPGRRRRAFQRSGTQKMVVN